MDTNLRSSFTTEATAAVVKREDASSQLSEKRRWTELLLVLFLALAGPLLVSTHVALYGHEPMVRSQANVSAIAASLQEIGAILVLCYILHISRRNTRTLGLRATVRGFIVGTMLFILMATTYYFAGYMLQLIHKMAFGIYATPPDYQWLFASTRVAALLPFFIINPFFEELIYRGYLMTELSDLTGSSVLAVVASVVVQTSYHTYQGWLSAAALFFAFGVLALFYVRTRQLFPVIAAHALADWWILLKLMMIKPA